MLPYVCVVSPQESLSHFPVVSCFLWPTHHQCHSRLSDPLAYSRQRQCVSAWGWWLLTRLCLGPHLGLSTTILTLVDSRSKVDFLGTPLLDVVCILRNVQFRFLWNDRMNSNDQKGSRSFNFLIFFSSVSKLLVCGHWVWRHTPDSMPAFYLKPSHLCLTMCQNPPT